MNTYKVEFFDQVTTREGIAFNALLTKNDELIATVKQDGFGGANIWVWHVAGEEKIFKSMAVKAYPEFANIQPEDILLEDIYAEMVGA